MIFTENLEIAWSSLWRNKLRLFLTMLGIIIGVASVILLISIGSGLQSYITEQFESLGSNLIFVTPGEIGHGGGPPGLRQTLSMRDVKTLRRLRYPVQDVSAYIEIRTTVKYRNNEKNTQIGGIEANGNKLLNLEAEKGNYITNGDVAKNARIAFIGPQIAEELYGEENPVGKSILIQSSNYKVIGIFKSKGGGGGIGGGTSFDETVFIPITTGQRQFNQDKLTMIYIKAANKDVIEDAKKKVEKELLKTLEEDDFSVLGQEDLLSTINQILSVLTAGLGGIAAISLLVGGIGIMNIMFVSVTERTREIGLRKALGARPKDIMIQFLVEAVTVSLIGGSIGILLAMTGSLILNRFLSSQVTPMAVLLAFGFSSVIGIIFGVAPAAKAAKLDPIDALRYE